MKNKYALWLLVFVGVCLVGCGVPPAYETQRQAKVVSVSPSGSLGTALPSQRVGRLERLVPAGKYTAALDAKLFPKGPIPQAQTPINVYGAKTFQLSQHTMRYRLAINYPNTVACGLKFTATSRKAWTISQWRSLLAEFQISAGGPTKWGTGQYEMPHPTMKLVSGSGSHHIEILFSGPKFYVIWMNLETKSGLSWRDAMQKLAGAGSSATLEMKAITCPGRRP